MVAFYSKKNKKEINKLQILFKDNDKMFLPDSFPEKGW